MITRLTLLSICICLFASISNAAYVESEASATHENTEKGAKSALNPAYNYESFLSLTPKAYRQLTGKKLTLRESISLKMTQKMVKKQNSMSAADSGLPKWAYILMSIFALGWLAIGIKSNFTGNDWWISLLLYFCFIIPGIIYSLIVMKKYY